MIFFTAAICLLGGGPTWAADEKKETNYCKDQTSWQEWHELLKKYPDDDSIHALYALRMGMCSMVESGTLTLDRATRIFERMRESVIENKKEQDRLSEKKSGHGT